MNRRSYCLAVGSAGLAGLSGCLSSVGSYLGSGSDGYVRPDGDPDTVPASFECQREGFERLNPHYDDEHLHWGDVGDYSMRVDALEFAYGETAAIELSADTRGSDDKWHIEIYTENGWQKVRGTASERDQQYLGYDDIGIMSDAEWRITLTEDGIIEAGGHEDILEVCPDLVSGRYRFVYWGVSGVDDEGAESAIAVAFDLDV